jgi:Tfp pilus assembly PilM family ATPase
MHTSLFFRLFPPPNYMLMKHAGLHISEDAIYFLEYGFRGRRNIISRYGQAEIPQGVIEDGNIVDIESFKNVVKDFDKKYDLSCVKVSVPEERAYLFQTEVPKTNLHGIAQNIEFKIEENVPLSGADAVFYFDLLPSRPDAESLRASVWVVQRTYIENYISILRDSGVMPIAFEVLPKAITRSVIAPNAPGAQIIIYVMSYKTGIYIVSDGVVAFTSTLNWGSRSGEKNEDVLNLIKEISRVFAYWTSHNDTSIINKIILVGKNSVAYEAQIRGALPDAKISVTVADVWQNSLDINKYVPPIPKEDSLDYVAAAGLAMYM